MASFRKPRVKTERPIAFFDCECYRNYFYVAFRTLDGNVAYYERSERADFDPDRIRKLLMKYTIVGFNSKNYDIFILLLALAEKSNNELKEASDQIIKGRMKPYQSERFFDIVIPAYIDHVDLFDVNPSVDSNKTASAESFGGSGSASLKTLGGRLHAKRMQDLPVEPGAWLTFEQMDQINDYCLNSDTVATMLLFEHLKEPLRLREVMGERYGIDFRSLSDAQMGERMIKAASRA